MSAPIRVRVSEAMQGMLDTVSANTSAATRALIVLGLHAAGYDLAGLRRDIAWLRAEELDAPVLAALTDIDGARRTAVGQVSYTAQLEPDGPDTVVDPLEDIGMESSAEPGGHGGRCTHLTRESSRAISTWAIQNTRYATR